MRIDIAEMSIKGISRISITHKGEQQQIEAGSYTSAAIIGREALFKEVNEFLATLSEEDQDRLWELYSTAIGQLASEEMQSSFMIRSSIENIVKEIYKVASYEALSDYVARARLLIPSDVKEHFEEFAESGNRNYRNRTYIRSDYQDMVVLALGLRFVVPLWGVYIQNVAAVNGNGFKESEAVKLIELAGVDRWPPYVRMVEFIEASVDKEVSMTMAMATLSSEEIPRHLMSMALVRKISIGPLSTDVEKESLARILFNYVTGTQQRMDSRFQSVTGVVQAKRNRLDRGDEDNSSVWDEFSQATEITEGDRQLIEVYTERTGDILAKIEPKVSISRAQQCISIVSRRDSRPVLSFQKALTFWVIRTISPESRDLLQKLTHFRLMGIAQAILDQWGYPELAVLVAAEEYIDEGGDVFMPSEVRNKITKQQLEILDKQYPYWRQETRRQDPGKRNNVAVIAIDQVVEWMSGRAWKPHAPRDIIAKVPGLAQTGHFYISGDIKRQMADMIIKTNIIFGSKVAS